MMALPLPHVVKLLTEVQVQGSTISSSFCLKMLVCIIVNKELSYANPTLKSHHDSRTNIERMLSVTPPGTVYVNFCLLSHPGAPSLHLFGLPTVTAGSNTQRESVFPVHRSSILHCCRRDCVAQSWCPRVCNSLCSHCVIIAIIVVAANQLLVLLCRRIERINTFWN